MSGPEENICCNRISVCGYICIYIYTHMPILYTCIYIYTHTCTYIYVYCFMYLSLSICICCQKKNKAFGASGEERLYRDLTPNACWVVNLVQTLHTKVYNQQEETLHLTSDTR